HFAILVAVIEIVETVKGRSNPSNGLALPGLSRKVGYVIARPHHSAATLALEPTGSPLRRPMMRVPDLMPLFHGTCKMHHVEIAAQECRIAQFGPAAAPYFYHSDVLADPGKTIGWV